MVRSSIQDGDREDVARFIERHWGSRRIMSCGRAYDAHELDGVVERDGDEIVGLVTMREDGDAIEVLTLNSTLEGQRIGSSLMLDVISNARAKGCRRLWLTTTNDNLRALGFYQRLGFRIVEVQVGMVDEARKVKPQIPEVGRDGIPIHDEIVLELRLKPYEDAVGGSGDG